MPETRTVPPRPIPGPFAAPGPVGQHPRARAVTARFWAELLITCAFMVGVSLADFAALQATAWDWHVSPYLAAWYVTMILMGWAAQFVVCAVVAQTAVHLAIVAGQQVRRAVAYCWALR